jgi:hypothetical protein
MKQDHVGNPTSTSGREPTSSPLAVLLISKIAFQR